MATPLAPVPYHSPLLQLPGAVSATGLDAGIAWHYGDPMDEQRAAVSSMALFDRSNRSVITVTGDDRLTWLHTLTSQFLSSMSDGQSTQALVLSPQGHVEHHFSITELDGTAYLDTEPGAGVGLLGYLDGMRFWSKVDVADASAAFGLLTLAGPKARTVAKQVLTPAAAALDLSRAVPLAAGGFVRPSDDGGLDLLVPRDQIAALARSLVAAGAVPAGSWAADALRIPTRRPRWGVDTDDRTIPNEVSWLATAVHLEKGCYRGQETVARVHNLGRPPRRLVMLNLDGSVEALPETGQPVVGPGGRVVGRVGTVAHHYEDGPIALALVKRTVDVGTPVLAGTIDAAVDPADALDAADTATPLSAIDRRALSHIRRN
ncbi:CAF17-like 4Fe-4S cluster assembly/insertion protein YgfZ [Nakamurella sp. GG22]